MAKLGNIEFTPLSYDEKNLTRILLQNNEDNLELIWVVIHPETSKLLNRDTIGDNFVGMLIQNSHHFYPSSSWGLHILCKTNGDDRPIADLSWIDYSVSENRIWSPDIDEA